MVSQQRQYSITLSMGLNREKYNLYTKSKLLESLVVDTLLEPHGVTLY